MKRFGSAKKQSHTRQVSFRSNSLANNVVSQRTAKKCGLIESSFYDENVVNPLPCDLQYQGDYVEYSYKEFGVLLL